MKGSSLALSGEPEPVPDAGEALRAELQRLRGKNTELEHCVNALAHDLRSPLVALLGFSRLLRQDYGRLLDDTGAHFLERIEQAGRTMESLVDDLLELSRIGREPGERVAVDPTSVLQQLQAELKPQLDERGVQLRLPDQPPLIHCNRTRLYQIFANLIGNAVEHMGDCELPGIEVEIRDDRDCHHLLVRDFGAGIDAADRERIFEALQTGSNRSASHRGTGMGLAIVRRIAEVHGGRAWVESELGRGSTFHVTLSRS